MFGICIGTRYASCIRLKACLHLSLTRFHPLQGARPCENADFLSNMIGGLTAWLCIALMLVGPILGKAFIKTELM
jgi:hypothetical protein